MRKMSAQIHIREEELKEKEDSFEKSFKLDQNAMKKMSAQIHIREEELREKEESFEKKKTNKETHICIAMRSLESEEAHMAEYQGHQKCKEEFEQKEELFTISDKHLKQGKLFLESEQIILKDKFKKIHIREEELKDKAETFEEMNSTMLEEFRRIGEASETFKICEEESK